jgi:hypothetical protein
MSSNSTISITYKFKGDSQGLKDLCKDVERMQTAFKNGVQPAEQLRTSLINFNQVAQSFEAIGAAVGQLNNVIQDLSNAYAIQQEAETKLTTVMQQRMNATDEQIQSIKEYCAAQQEIGIIGDEVQLAGAQQLATFLNNTEALKALIPAMNNLIAQQKGYNATSGDAVAIANLFGKAMQGQTSALKRVGITFSDAEAAAVKNGDEMQRAAALAKIITNNVGEMNQALAQTDAGKAKQLANAMGDLKEKLGGIVASIAPYTTFASSIVTTAANAGRAASSMRALYTATLGANGAFKFISASSVAATLGMNSAGVAARFLAAGLRMILAATGVGLVIEGISLAVDALTSSARKGKDALNDFSDAEDKAKQAAESEKMILQNIRSQITQDIAATKNFTGSKKKEKKLVEELNQRYGETMGYFSSVSSWYKALVKNSEAYCTQMVREARVRLLANQIAEKEQLKYNLTHDKNGKALPEVRPGVSAYNPWDGGVSANRTKMADDLTSQINADKKQMDAILKEGKEVMPLMGAATAPSSSTSSKKGSHNTKTAEAKKEKDALEQIEEQIRANQKAAMTASDEELPAIREETLQLIAKRDKLREVQDSITKSDYTPPAISAIKTYEDLDKAMQYYSDLLHKAQPEDRADIQATINALNKLKEGWDKALNPSKPSASALDEYIDRLTTKNKFKSQGSTLEGVNLSSLISGYRELESVLSGVDGDITAKQRESLQKTAEEYARYAKKAVTSMQTVKSAWSGVKGISQGIDDIKSALEGSGTAWEKTIKIVDAAIQIYDGIASIVEIVKTLSTVIKMLTTAQQAQTAATVSGATAEVSASTAKVAATNAETTANIAAGASGFFKANSSIPIIGLILAAAGVAAMIAMMATLPKYANGGIAFGPTVGLFGEYAGASSNPEVVAPLDRLQGMLDTGNGTGGELTCRVSGSDLEFVLNRRLRKKSRM